MTVRVPRYRKKHSREAKGEYLMLTKLDELTNNLHILLHPHYPSGHVFLNKEEHALVLIADQKTKICTFSYKEWKLFETLLLVYPSSASFPELFASISSWSVEECERRFSEIRRRGRPMKDELAPLYDGMRTMRQKLRSVHVDICSVRMQGYVLTSQSKTETVPMRKDG